ncbi:hypothetical protein C1Y63_10680 [Corynebacterium sp. 13CS0277]|uniref:TRAFAC clade GTPase domain-containing protein n=1 Tax=Corynebacterium sp. 13CS0277 TaxID=2071994 RepID=UPI000D046AB6|nr:hypothetical protein [Corynebacterium sp. 13CS0277]PRQ10570.1 hypothetical protein C1Y63_10680 [Corynebacterium sp. 13CS0277]
MSTHFEGRLLTRCPYTFKQMPPDATASPFVDAEDCPLPEGWQGSGVITFAMAGARASGKSLYIAVVVKLLEQLAVANGAIFRPADEYTRRTYREKYEKPLFTHMGLLPSTPSSASADAYQRKPLIFDLGMFDRKDENGNRSPQKIFVVFRDVAGEDLKEENFEARKDDLTFFRYADRIIFLFDPMRVSQIRELLQGAVPRHEVGDDDPAVVLQNVLRVLGAEARPYMALTLSKFDTMQYLANVNQVDQYYDGNTHVNWQRVMSNCGAGFRRESSDLDAPFRMKDQELLHWEVQSLLQCLGATMMLSQLAQPMLGEHPYPYQCFAVSALGAPPEGDRVSRSGIAPFRCLDPLRAMFATVGLFTAEDT